MKRRTALKTISSALSAGLTIPALPAFLTSCEPSDPVPEIQYDGTVAIIGAGASGLYAADILKSKGINVKVYEASERAGGRVRSIRASEHSPVKTDFPIELGAERILGSDSLWHRIISQANIPVVETAGLNSHYFIFDEAFHSLDELSADVDFASAVSFFESLPTRDLSAGSVTQLLHELGVPERVFPLLNALVGNRYGADNNRLGVMGIIQSLRMLQRDAKEFVLQSNPMQDALVSRFGRVVEEIDFNSAIESVDYSSGKVVLTGKRNGEAFTEEADKVIVTVPLPILRDALSFTPSLPEAKVGALAALDMAPAVRVVLDFKDNFWSDGASVVLGHPYLPEMFASGHGRSTRNQTLSITAFGESAELLGAQGSEGITYILEALDTIFDNKATLNIRRNDDQSEIFEMVNWTEMPFIRGGMSYLKPGAPYDHRLALAAPIGGIVFFAGEATDVDGDAGTVNGALQAAARAVGEVVESITG